MPKIIIIDKKEFEAQRVFDFCRKLGYRVVAIIDNYQEAMSLIHKELPDLLIVEIDLESNQEGIKIAQDAQERYGTATIFLTNSYNENIYNKVKNIRFYGYCLKPFREKELEANLRLALTQVEQSRKTKKRFISFGEYIFDLKLKKLYDNREEIHLSKRIKELISFLACHIDETKSYREIIESVYQTDTISIDTLRHLIKRTRDIIGKDSIISIKGEGYRLSFKK